MSFSPLPTKSGLELSNRSDEGGSSPVVPILIAVAVLAALSVGIAFHRGHSRPARR